PLFAGAHVWPSGLGGGYRGGGVLGRLACLRDVLFGDHAHASTSVASCWISPATPDGCTSMAKARRIRPSAALSLLFSAVTFTVVAMPAPNAVGTSPARTGQIGSSRCPHRPAALASHDCAAARSAALNELVSTVAIRQA